MLFRKSIGEFIGTALLVMTVVGSGIMAQNLTQDVGLALLINTLATVFMLGVIISLFAPLSGAHFNPVVTVASALRKVNSWTTAGAYIVSQFAGGILGTAVANIMFNKPLLTASLHTRSAHQLLLGEVIATAGLVFLIFNRISKNLPMQILVPAWIGSAYFFTASTSFANPAVTFARAWSNSFAGIAPASVLGFVGAQLVGAGLGLGMANFLTVPPERKSSDHMVGYS